MDRFLWIILVGLLACEDTPVLETDLGLRIENVSAYTFENIAVSSGGPEVDYGSLGNGQTSEYREFNSIYRFGTIRIQISDREVFILAPGV